MSSLELLKDVYYVGYVDWEVRNFHGYSTHKGSSYNAYIVKSGEKTILIDTVKRPYFEYYLENIQAVCDPKDIDYFIITDVRFPQEMKMIKDLGGHVFRIEAPERTLKKLKEECGENYMKRASHISETALDNVKFDYVIHNDVKDAPEYDIQKAVISLGISA